MPVGKTAVHISDRYTRHEMPRGHPESPARIRRLLDDPRLLTLDNVMRVDSSRRAGRDDLLRVHEASYIDRVASTADRPSAMLDPDTHTSKFSYDTALCAAGGLLDVIDAIADGSADNGFALVRPPGHHAEVNRAMGFCLFNNVAIGARHLREKQGLDRVLIIDWDVHHGNGTQNSFYEDSGVMFVSIHQSPCYPGTGRAHETGSLDGAGYNINIPLPPGCGDAEYAAAFERVVLPVARAWKPQFVLVSAGFDAHRDDPLAGMNVTEAGYKKMAADVLEVAAESADGRCAAVLEGGYHLDALAGSVTAVVSAMGDGEAVGGVRIEKPARGRVEDLLGPTLSALSKFWKL
jgi:acetoin utilization deacetylase AcuC-like enzyme